MTSFPAPEPFRPDPEREEQEWQRIACECGATLGYTSGTIIRYRCRERWHGKRQAVFTYFDTAGGAPVRIATVPDLRKRPVRERHHGSR